MKTYRGRWGTAPFILNLGRRWIWVVTIKPRPPHSRERTPVSNEREAGWASDQVRTFWRQEKSLTPPKIQMPDRPACRTYNNIAWKVNTASNTSPWLQPSSFCSQLHEYERLRYPPNVRPDFQKEMLWISFKVKWSCTSSCSSHIYTVFAYLQNFAKVVTSSG